MRKLIKLLSSPYVKLGLVVSAVFVVLNSLIIPMFQMLPNEIPALIITIIVMGIGGFYAVQYLQEITNDH